MGPKSVRSCGNGGRTAGPTGQGNGPGGQDDRNGLGSVVFHGVFPSLSTSPAITPHYRVARSGGGLNRWAACTGGHEVGGFQPPACFLLTACRLVGYPHGWQCPLQLLDCRIRNPGAVDDRASMFPRKPHHDDTLVVHLDTRLGQDRRTFFVDPLDPSTSQDRRRRYPFHRRHGGRITLLTILFASSSWGNCSRSGSHSSLRMSFRAMLPR